MKHNPKNRYHLLDRLAQRHMPDTLDILPALQQQMNQRATPPSRRIASPLVNLRLNSALIAAVVLLLGVGIVYAVAQFAIHDPAIKPDMITEIGQSQTIGDTTVTLDWAYADANRISLAYTISDATGQFEAIDDRFKALNIHLTDDQARLYKPISAFYADYDTEALLTVNGHFDASVIDDTPQALNLELTLLDGFTFAFTVPFIASINIDKQPDVVVHDIAFNLEWAVITPSMTRVHVCYEAPGDDVWVPSLALAFDGKQVAREAGASYPDYGMYYKEDIGRWCRTHIFLTQYETLPQTVTLTAGHLQSPHRYSRENMEQMAAVYAEYGIDAVVMRNETSAEESYLLSFAELPEDFDLRDKIEEEARQKMGAPLKGERIEGPWIITLTLP